MARYIELDALLAEIERLQDVLQDPAMNRESMQDYAHGGNKIINEILSFLNTIEVKEIGVDLGDPKGDKSAKHIIDTKTLEVKEVDLDFTKEPVSEELEEEIVKRWKVLHGSGNPTPFDTFNGIACHFAKWQKEKMMKDAKSGTGNYDNYIKFEDGTWIDLDPSEQLKPAFNVNEGDKVKVIVIK